MIKVVDMKMASAVEGFQAVWPVLETVETMKCWGASEVCCAPMAHTEHEVLRYISQKGPSGRATVVLAGKTIHFKCWLLTFNHVIRSANPLQPRELTAPFPTTYVGQKQLMCPASLHRVESSPAGGVCLPSLFGTVAEENRG